MTHWYRLADTCWARGPESLRVAIVIRDGASWLWIATTDGPTATGSAPTKWAAMEAADLAVAGGAP